MICMKIEINIKYSCNKIVSIHPCNLFIINHLIGPQESCRPNFKFLAKRIWKLEEYEFGKFDVICLNFKHYLLKTESKL